MPPHRITRHRTPSTVCGDHFFLQGSWTIVLPANREIGCPVPIPIHLTRDLKFERFMQLAAHATLNPFVVSRGERLTVFSSVQGVLKSQRTSIGWAADELTISIHSRGSGKLSLAQYGIGDIFCQLIVFLCCQSRIILFISMFDFLFTYIFLYWVYEYLHQYTIHLSILRLSNHLAANLQI